MYVLRHYRKLSITRRGAYLIFPVIGGRLKESCCYSRAALIPTTGKALRRIWRELSEGRTSYAQFDIKYVHLELLV